jgi:DinB superfamily
MPDSPKELSIDQVAALLRATAETLRAEAEAIGSEGLRWHPAPGEWCINEVLGHLIEAERRGFAGRVQQIVADPGCKLETWDQAKVARERLDCEVDGLELMREFVALREESLSVLAGLTPAQLQLSGRHPEVGELRIGELLQEWVHHDRNHVKQTLSNVQAYVWPHMGSTQRFSEME